MLLVPKLQQLFFVSKGILVMNISFRISVQVVIEISFQELLGVHFLDILNVLVTRLRSDALLAGFSRQIILPATTCQL